MKKSSLLAFLGLGAFAVLPLVQASADKFDVQAAKYAACVQEADSDPRKAMDTAVDWQAVGGGIPARHCIALALINLGQYEIGAERLEQLGEDIQMGHDILGLGDVDLNSLQAEINGQAGNAWLMTEEFGRAYSALSAALTEAPAQSRFRVEYFIDRARALAGLEQYQKSLDDLDKAAQLAPERADIYVFRASAYRALGALDRAEEDLATALKLNPDSVSALLEQGIIFRMLGKDVEARADWLAIVTKFPDTPEAEIAAENLKLMDEASDATPATQP